MVERVTEEAGASEEPSAVIQVKMVVTWTRVGRARSAQILICFEGEATGVDDGLGCRI